MILKIQRDQGTNAWSVAQAVAFLIAVAASLILLSLAFYWGVPVNRIDTGDGGSYNEARDLASSRIALLLLLGIWAHVLAQYAMSRTNRSRSVRESSTAESREEAPTSG